MTHDLVICTLDRPRELDRCLESVASQTAAPGRVLVIDASDDDLSAAVVARHAAKGLPVEHLRAPKGLTRQRNVGLDSSQAEIVHFVDDDVVLEPGYLDAILDVFARDRTIGGVGGLPTNVPPRRRGRRRATEGRVMRSGRGVLVLRADREVEADWLSGCCMSFRRSALDPDRFDESIPGYALGEDLELSYRVRQRHRLIVTPTARLEHRQSPVNRLARTQWGHDDVVNRHRRVLTRTGRYDLGAFWLGVLAQTAWHIAHGLRPRAADHRALARGLARGAWRAATRRRVERT
jgi:GT2 family glycosyltransferase